MVCHLLLNYLVKYVDFPDSQSKSDFVRLVYDFVLNHYGSQLRRSTVVWIRRGIPEVVDRRVRVDHSRILIVAEQHDQSGATCGADGRHSME